MLILVGFLTLLQGFETVDIGENIQSHRHFRSLLLKRKICALRFLLAHTHSFNSTAIWICFFRFFVCSDFPCNKICLFSITPCQVFVNAISTSCDFCLKNGRYFFFLYLMLHELLLQKF